MMHQLIGRCECEQPTRAEPFVGMCSYCEDRAYWEAMADFVFAEIPQVETSAAALRALQHQKETGHG